uniref:Uncharacterized protein n=1 Tax=Solibacter usitatus (strain Ellin6076) TaxID=234267 RepID=Q01VT7_SOLUE
MRTPAGTCSGRCKESADGSMATKARRSQRAGQQSKENMRKGKAMVGGSSALEARMRRRLKLRQGASPLRPPPPFPRVPDSRTVGIRQGFASPRNTGAPLTDSHRSEERAEMRERGPLAKRER